MLGILEGIQQPDQPRRLDGRQNIPLHQYMLHLVHLGQCAFTHFLQRAHFLGIGFTSEIDGTITALPDLSEDAELVDAEFCTAFTEQDAFAPVV